MRSGDAVEVLVRFSREMAATVDPAAVPPALVQSAVAAGAAAAGVLEIVGGGRACLVAQAGLPEPMAGWTIDADTIDADLGRQLGSASGAPVGDAHTLLLVASGDLFGALVVFCAPGSALGDDCHRLVTALADIAASALGRAFQFAELNRSYAALQASRAALARSEKLRALGQMAAGVAHDLVNILYPLSLSSKFIRAHIEANFDRIEPDVLASFENSERVLKRGMETILRLRDFSRQAPERPASPQDLARLATEALDICRPRLASKRSHIDLVADLKPAAPVLVRPDELVNAVVNLVVNAIDAVAAQGGRVTVSTGGDDGGAWVRVHDTGPGIPADVQPRIFEPFFTTKGDEGTGLGLPMVYAFVQRHGGELTLDSSPERGTTFTLRFEAVRSDP